MEYIVIVRTQLITFHAWPEAPDDIAFLREKHRHTFFIELAIKERHSDRDVEFIQLKRWLDDFLNRWRDADLGSMSCEKMAKRIIEAAIEQMYLPVYCRVMEDDENGAEVRV